MILKRIFVDSLIGAVCAVCLTGISSGIATSWSSPVIPKLQNTSDGNPFDQPVTNLQASWMTSLVTLGACAGCLIFGYLAQAVGRRFAMCSLNVPMALGHLLMVIFPKVGVFYLARFLTGISVGGGQITAMTYNSEITSKYNRGVIMTFAGMMVSVGSLFGFCIGPWIAVSTFNTIIALVPIATTFLALLFCVETPYFYLIKNKEELAEKSLRAYRGSNAKIEKEIIEIKENIKGQQEGHLIDVIKTKAFLKSFIIATTLLIFQQFTGINGILMHSQSIFEITGSNFSSAVCSIFLGAIQVVSGGVGPLVADKFNRKTLLITSSLGMALSEIILGIYCIFSDSGKNVDSFNFVPITTLCFFIFSYNFGIGPLCWIVGAEVYSTRVKTFAMSFSIITYHVIGFFIVQFFNDVRETIGIGQVFIIFAVFCILCIFFVQFYVIETKCKSLEEIQNILSLK